VASLKAISDSSYSDRCYHAWYVRLSGWPSVMLVHSAKAAGWNEMPFGRDTCVVPSNIILDRGLSPPTGMGRFGDRNPQSKSKF